MTVRDFHKAANPATTRVIVAWGGVSLVRLCVPERVLPIRRVRGWVGAKPKRPRVVTRGYPEPLLRSSIRIARKGRFAGLPTPTAASQLSPYLQRCKGKRAFLFGICPGQEPVASHRETFRRGVKPRTRRLDPGRQPGRKPAGGSAACPAEKPKQAAFSTRIRCRSTRQTRGDGAAIAWGRPPGIACSRSRFRSHPW